MEGSHSFSRNLISTIPGEREDTLIIAVPLDQGDGAEATSDGSLNLALALALLEELKGSSPPITVSVLFLGGEHETLRSYPIGTDRFLQDFYPESPVAVLFLNFKEFPEAVSIQSGAKYGTTPYWLMEACSTALDRTDISYRLRGNEHQVFRVGMTDSVTIIEPFLNEEFPAIAITGSGSTGEMADESSLIFSFLLFFQEFLGTLSGGFPEEWDKHFLFFQIGGKKIIVRENVYVLILIIIFSGLFLYSLLFRNRVKKYLGILVHHLGTLPVLYIVIFLCILAGTFVLEGVSQLKSYPAMWKVQPFFFLCLKASVAFLLFFLVFRFLRKRYFSFRGSFYSAAAMMFLILTTITVTVINVSFSYYFAWAFICAFIFSLLKRRFLKLILLCLAPFWLFKMVYDVFTLPSLKVIEFILYSRLAGNLLFALFVLPFVLMLIRLSLLHKHAVGKRQRIQHLSLLLFFGVSSLFFAVYIYLTDPWNHADQPVYVEESIDLVSRTRYMQISSPAPIGDLSISGSGYNSELHETQRESLVPGSTIPELISITEMIEPFLDRRRITLKIESIGFPSDMTAALTGDEQIIVYDANFPFSNLAREKRTEIYIGKNPPNPLLLEFTIPREADLVLHLEVVYKVLPYDLRIEGEKKKIYTLLRVKDQINFF